MRAGVGDEDLVRGCVDGDGRRTIQRRLAVLVARLAGLADLKEELPVARELQHVCVRRRGGALPRRRLAS